MLLVNYLCALFINVEIFILTAIVEKTNRFGHMLRAEGFTQTN